MMRFTSANLLPNIFDASFATNGVKSHETHTYESPFYIKSVGLDSVGMFGNGLMKGGIKNCDLLQRGGFLRDGYNSLKICGIM